MATMRYDELNTPAEQVVDHGNVLDIDTFFDEMYLSDSEIEERKDLAKNIYTILAAILTIIKANEVLKNNHDIAYYKDYVSSNLEIVFDNTFGPGAYRNLVQTFANDFIDSTMRHIDTPYFTSDDRAIVNAEQQSNAVYNQKQYENAVASGKTRKTWVTMHDQRVRKSHDAADGQEVDIDKPFTVGDSELMFPCDLSLGAHLKEVCGCRCVVNYDGGNDNTTNNSDAVVIDDKKVIGYLLNPEKDHYQEFINVGYNENNPQKFKGDILSQYDYNKAIDIEDTKFGKKFSIVMDLGVSETQKFRTVWQVDKDSNKPRLITVYKDRMVE